MNKISVISNTKEDFNDLESFLRKENLIDQRAIWFGGFDDKTRGGQNAIARNLLYGNKHLMIITVKDDDIYYLRNTKEGFVLYEVGKVSDKYNVKVYRNIMYPSIEIHMRNDKSIHIQSNKNKKQVSVFKKLIK